jgi:hypothetical protein
MKPNTWLSRETSKAIAKPMTTVFLQTNGWKFDRHFSSHSANGRSALSFHDSSDERLES